MTQSPEPVVVVPREPTEAMIAAGSQAASQCGGWIGDGRLVRAYRAMISAAPASPDPLLEEAVGLADLADDFERRADACHSLIKPDLEPRDRMRLHGKEAAYRHAMMLTRAFLAKLGRA